MPNQGGSHEQHVNTGQQSRKNDPDKRRMGQQKSEDNHQDQQGGGQRGGSGNFANDRDRASEAGRKGGQS
jgi:uncharacterized protein